MKKKLMQEIRSRLYVYSRRLPAGMRVSTQRNLTTALYHNYMKEKLGHFYINVDEGPIPPDDITMRTSIMSQKDVKNVITDDNFFASAYIQLFSWLYNL